MRPWSPRCAWPATALAALLIAGCGSSYGPASATSDRGPARARASASSATAAAPPAIDELTGAEHPGLALFPATQGRSLTQLGDLAGPTATLGAATGTFTPGTRRFAFALTAASGRYVYAPTAVYIAPNPQAPAQGPFLAAADPMTVSSQYRSKQNAGPGGIQAIYAAQVPVHRPGTEDVLSLTRTSTGLTGATGEIAVAASSPIPDVGQRPPDIATDTLATVHGDVTLLTTRSPPEQMHSVSFNRVLGSRPVVLLFSTPQLCVSRVCGPVTDVAVELQHRFGDRITFIHEEVYVDNQPSRGLRPQLKAFHLRTEPWLFAIDRRGIIVARLEGAFGTTELTQALKAALR